MALQAIAMREIQEPLDQGINSDTDTGWLVVSCSYQVACCHCPDDPRGISSPFFLKHILWGMETKLDVKFTKTVPRQQTHHQKPYKYYTRSPKNGIGGGSHRQKALASVVTNKQHPKFYE